MVARGKDLKRGERSWEPSPEKNYRGRGERTFTVYGIALNTESGGRGTRKIENPPREALEGPSDWGENEKKTFGEGRGGMTWISAK